MSVTVKWNKKKYNIKFTLDTIKEGPWTDYFTLYDLKKRCNELTHVPIDRMKLLYAGATMKDDKASLTRYGIKNGSSILLLGNAEKKEKLSQPENIQSSDQEETGFYPMPKPGNNYQHIQQPPQGYNPMYQQQPGFYPPPHGYDYRYPQPGFGYGYPPPPGYGYSPNGYPTNNPAMPNQAFLSSPSQNPSQTIRIPGSPNNNNDYTNNPFYPPTSPNPYSTSPQPGYFQPTAPSSTNNPAMESNNPFYQKPSGNPPPYEATSEGLYPNPDSQTNTPGSASPNPAQNTSKMSKEELVKQAKEQPIVFLDNCINETRSELEPLVNMYADKVSRHPNGKPMTKDLEQNYLKASELLMQKLLLVDQVMAGQNEEIRNKRKTAVKLIQGLIDKLDESKTKLKQKIGK